MKQRMNDEVSKDANTQLPGQNFWWFDGVIETLQQSNINIQEQARLETNFGVGNFPYKFSGLVISQQLVN